MYQKPAFLIRSERSLLIADKISPDGRNGGFVEIGGLLNNCPIFTVSALVNALSINISQNGLIKPERLTYE